MKKIDLLNFDWSTIQKYHNEGNDKTKIKNKFGLSRKVIDRGISEGLLKFTHYKRKLTDEQKEKVRIGRIKFLKENPNQHPWKRKGKQKSIPCEKLKTILQENGLIFNEEYTPIESDRFYSMDISFLKNKIGIEVNGNQHYNSDGTLKEYYRIRNEHFIKLGWKIIEVHYSKIYLDEFVVKLVDYLKTLDEYSYEELTELNNLVKFNKGIEDKHCSCGKKILKNSKTCNKCSNINRRKIVRPEYDVLIKDIKELGYKGTGRKYGVSDNAIRKWCKRVE
jgi:very-short-patch-repair endonuclease